MLSEGRSPMVTVICNDAWRKGDDEDNKVIGDTLKKCKSISTMKMIWNSSHGKKSHLHTCERPNKRRLNSKTGAPFLFRAVGRTMVIRGRFPSPWMSNVRLRYFDIALGIPSTAASSVALYTCMEGGVNITVAYTKLWAGIEARCGSIS